MSARVFGISMVRNEADIIALNVLHHLSLGLDGYLIIDNGSSDGTDRVLQKLATDKRVRWSKDNSPYQQSEFITQLAREVFKCGGDWVVPIDADEFWHIPQGSFKAVLTASTAGALCVQVVNFIQRVEQKYPSPDALLFMTRRALHPVGPIERCRELVESRQIAYVEMMYPPKWISRASAQIKIAAGNHDVSGVDGPHEDTSQIVILHAPLRSRATLNSKADHGRRVEQISHDPESHWHLRRFRCLQDAEGLDQEWRANSYANDTLDFYGIERKVIFDPRLRAEIMKAKKIARQIPYLNSLDVAFSR
jgi:glycosyltransferase involved in cell wall biosynthesis